MLTFMLITKELIDESGEDAPYRLGLLIICKWTLFFRHPFSIEKRDPVRFLLNILSLSLVSLDADSWQSRFFTRGNDPIDRH